MYVLLNRGNIVVDILDNLRYIKLQSSNSSKIDLRLPSRF